MTAVKIEVKMTFDLGVTFTALRYSQGLLTEPEARTQSSTILAREHVMLKRRDITAPPSRIAPGDAPTLRWTPSAEVASSFLASFFIPSLRCNPTLLLGLQKTTDG